MRNSSLKRSGMAHDNEGSHGFTCHPSCLTTSGMSHIPAFTLSNPLLPARDYLPDHHVHRNYFSNNYFLVGGRARAAARIELRTSATAHATFYCTWRPND